MLRYARRTFPDMLRHTILREVYNMYSEAENQETAVKNSIDDFGCLMNAFGFESDIQYLTIIGSIEGHNVLASDVKTTKYENMIPQLIAVQENPKIRGLLMVLHTVGGDVEAGLALAELISSISKPDSFLSSSAGGHSIGIPLAVSADYSFIAPSAAMTLHPVRTTGRVIGAGTDLRIFPTNAGAHYGLYCKDVGSAAGSDHRSDERQK